MPLIERRTFLTTALAGLPTSVLAQPSRRQIAKVGNGDDRLIEPHTVGVSTTAFKVLTEESNGALFTMENRMTRKGGPPRHLHHAQDEWFYVIEGDFIAEIGDHRFRLSPGESILGPREVPHAYAFIGSTVGRLLIAYAPAGQMEAFFRGRTEGAQYSTDAERYRAFGMELLGPPLTIEP
ncbi:MAG TPA: cupin domain-containing protein [Gemmatimonadaceae bacterium]|nr:cupin domain-containing protein [Gemmatimonadaceae bacterium]